MRYVVLFKKFFESQNKVALVDEVIEAADFQITEVGALVFVDVEGINTHAIPPGMWMDVQPAAAEVSKSSIVVP